jgi:hypothetical protein
MSKTLWDQLNEAYPIALSTDVSEAINGTKLLLLVRPHLDGDFKDNAIRQYFSEMSKYPSTRIAKKSDGQGYYLRSPVENGSTTTSGKSTAATPPKVPGTRDDPGQSHLELRRTNSDTSCMKA